jgi:hypothetical protein
MENYLGRQWAGGNGVADTVWGRRASEIVDRGSGLRDRLSAAVRRCGRADVNADAAVRQWFEQLSLLPPTRANIVICHGFGCAFRTPVLVTDADRATLATMMRGKTPNEERKGLARAEVWFDKRFGKIAGTTTAKAHASGVSTAGDRTQFDCVDRATNTTALLVVLQQWGLLKHHTVEGPAARMFIPIVGAPHNTAVVAEIKNGKKWVIDPWTHNFGETPDVMPLDTWLAIER